MDRVYNLSMIHQCQSSGHVWKAHHDLISVKSINEYHQLGLAPERDIKIFLQGHEWCSPASAALLFASLAGSSIFGRNKLCHGTLLGVMIRTLLPGGGTHVACLQDVSCTLKGNPGQRLQAQTRRMCTFGILCKLEEEECSARG